MTGDGGDNGPPWGDDGAAPAGLSGLRLAAVVRKGAVGISQGGLLRGWDGGYAGVAWGRLGAENINTCLRQVVTIMTKSARVQALQIH